MRHITFIVTVAALGLAAPAFGQAPYPYYGPMPYGPAYPRFSGPGYMSPPPMYYPPAPMMPPQQPMYAPQQPQKVYVYGPLDAPAAMAAQYLPGAEQAHTPVRQMQADVGTLMVPSKKDLPREACEGDSCGDTCGDSCPAGDCCKSWTCPIRGKGHFIAEFGAYFLVPFPSPNTAYNVAGAGGSNFAHQVDTGPRASVGYLTATGWGVRGNYWFLTGSTSTSVGNPAGSGTTIATPTTPLSIISPSATANLGLGVDQFTFTQNLQLHVADIEALKQFSFLDTTFLASLGGRYAQINQGYIANRNNPGGAAGTQVVALDREDLSTSSFFHGWGPTISLEAVHPLTCGLSLYGNIRGSFLFGTDRYSQIYGQQNRTVTGGAPVFTDISNATNTYDTRVVSILELEAGLQYGCTISRCYYFARIGAVYQRWFDVGSPTTADGSLTFLGGTVRLGVAY